MKIVAANYAENLRRQGSTDTGAVALIDTVREELRSLYGDAEDHVPLELAALVERLDRTDASRTFVA
jgi:hypothetical protein